MVFWLLDISDMIFMMEMISIALIVVGCFAEGDGAAVGV